MRPIIQKVILDYKSAGKRSVYKTDAGLDDARRCGCGSFRSPW
jgi:hypothetical protein